MLIYFFGWIEILKIENPKIPKRPSTFLTTGFDIEICTIARLRWLDWISWGEYLPSLSINYVAMSKDMEKRFPQLYYIKMKISHDLGFIAIAVAMAT